MDMRDLHFDAWGIFGVESPHTSTAATAWLGPRRTTRGWRLPEVSRNQLILDKLVILK